MANCCLFSMKIIGEKSNINKFMEQTKNSAHWCNRTDEETFLTIDGDCKWSLENCFIKNKPTLEELTRDLHLKVEAWSEVWEDSFQEHYLYKNGECIVDEWADNDNGETLVEKWHI